LRRRRRIETEATKKPHKEVRNEGSLLSFFKRERQKKTKGEEPSLSRRRKSRGREPRRYASQKLEEKFKEMQRKKQVFFPVGSVRHLKTGSKAKGKRSPSPGEGREASPFPPPSQAKLLFLAQRQVGDSSVPVKIEQLFLFFSFRESPFSAVRQRWFFLFWLARISCHRHTLTSSSSFLLFSFYSLPVTDLCRVKS